jgi:hypothetical protein
MARITETETRKLVNALEQFIGSTIGITQSGEKVFRVVGDNENSQEKYGTEENEKVRVDRLVTHTAKDAAKVLMQKNAPIYRHNRKPVVIDRQTAKMTVLPPVEAPSWFEKNGITFLHFLGGQWIGKTLNETEAKALLPALIDHLRPLSRVLTAEMPYLNDGKPELPGEGYNAKTQSLTIKTVEYADKNMPLEDARATFNLAFRDVAWPPNDQARSQSVAIASMLTPYLTCYFRASMRRPCFLFTSNTVGAGKTTLLYFPLTTIFGAPIYTTSPPAKNDDANVSKLLESVAQSGRPYLAIDNWDKKVDSGPLAQLITANAMTGRILGGAAMFDAVVQCLIFITANTKHFSEEMRRRTLNVDLYVEQARAEDRPISKPLDEDDVAAMRPELLSALWSYVRSWHEAGCPPPKSPSHASFPEWGRIVGGILEHAGHVSPLLPARRVVDPKLDRFVHLVKAVAKQMAEKGEKELATKPGDLMETARSTGKFDAFLDPDGPDEKTLRSDRMKFKQQCETYDEGRIFQLDDGSQVRFAAEGEGHSKRYVFTLL